MELRPGAGRPMTGVTPAPLQADAVPDHGRAQGYALASFSRQAEHLLPERFSDPEASLPLEVVQDRPYGRQESGSFGLK